MLKLYTLAETKAPDQGSHWYELAPGPDDQRFWAPDGAYFSETEWEVVGELLIGPRIPAYCRYGRLNGGPEVWVPITSYLGDVSGRLREADEPAMLHVLLPELPDWMRWELCKNWPVAAHELADELDAICDWVQSALQRWRSITFIGM